MPASWGARFSPVKTTLVRAVVYVGLLNFWINFSTRRRPKPPPRSGGGGWRGEGGEKGCSVKLMYSEERVLLKGRPQRAGIGGYLGGRGLRRVLARRRSPTPPVRETAARSKSVPSWLSGAVCWFAYQLNVL